MKKETREKKQVVRAIKEIKEKKWLEEKMYQIIREGKQAMDSFMFEMGKAVAETIMYIEREEIAGKDYHPAKPGVYKWASQEGSVFIGNQKVQVEHPRLRGPDGEISLETYSKLKERGTFSEELLGKMLRGLSARRYNETVSEAVQAFGVTPSSISQHLVEVTGRKLKEFKERRLEDFKPFAMFIDTIHRGGCAFMIALGIDLGGEKKVLGFWEGATENHDLCEELLRDIESRGLGLVRRIIFVTDGGKGIIKALRSRFGKKLIHQRCTIHKDHNIQRHLPKRFRKEAHRRFTTALGQKSYADAKAMLNELERWLRGINESAADSLREAFEELLTLHRLKVPEVLRVSLHSTNAIESMFSTVRFCEGNIKRYRGSNMSQRWLAAVCLHCERGFRKVKGYQSIPAVVTMIETEHEEDEKKAIAA